MNLNYRSVKHAPGLVCVVLTGLLLAGCSQTAPPAAIQVAQAPGEQAVPPPMTSLQATQTAVAGGQYEEPPVINAAYLLLASALSGPGFSVQPQVPTNGATGQYTIVADAVFLEKPISPKAARLELDESKIQRNRGNNESQKEYEAPNQSAIG
jgi:hypothetical protein